MNITPIPRRSFLKLSLAAASVSTGLIASGCSFFETTKEKNITSFGTLLVLNQQEADILFSFAFVTLPLDTNFPNIIQSQVINRLDEELFFVSDFIAENLKEAIGLLEYLPMLYGYFSRFSKLSYQQRLDFLQSAQQTTSTTVRAITNNCRLLIFTMYYGHESSWNAIKYDGPFSKTPQKSSLQRDFYMQQVKTNEA